MKTPSSLFFFFMFFIPFFFFQVATLTLKLTITISHSVTRLSSPRCSNILTNFSGEPRFFSEGVCLSFPSAAWRGQETSCGSVLVLQKFSLSFFSLVLFTRLCSALMQISKHNITVNWERVSARNGHNQTSWCFFGPRQRLVIKTRIVQIVANSDE